MLYCLTHVVESNMKLKKEPLLTKNAIYIRHMEYTIGFDTDTMQTELIKISYQNIDSYCYERKVYNEELLKKINSSSNTFGNMAIKDSCYVRNTSCSYVDEAIQMDKDTFELLNNDKNVTFYFQPSSYVICEDGDEIYIKIRKRRESIKSKLDLSNMKITFEETNMLVYNTIIINMYKERCGLQLFDGNNNEIKILKKNIWEFFKYYDLEYIPNLNNNCIRHYINNNNSRKIKYILWEMYKSHTAEKARAFEILHKAGYDNILNHVIDTRYEFDITGSNPQKILRLSKNALKFLKNNEDKLKNYRANSFRAFRIHTIKSLEDKHGPNFTRLFDLYENLSKELNEIKTNDYVIDNIDIFSNIDTLELLHKHNYTKNNKNLALYIKDTLPERQGILSILDAQNYFLEYLKLVDELNIKDFIKYPDSLIKEIALLKKTKLIRLNKEKEQIKELLINIKKSLFEKNYGKIFFKPLLTQEDLTSESSRMNNCVRSYNNTLYGLNDICISMRTFDDKSICTLELRNYVMKNVIFLKDLENNGAEILTPNFENVQFLQSGNRATTAEQRDAASKYVIDINNAIADLKANKHILKEMKVAVEQ